MPSPYVPPTLGREAVPLAMGGGAIALADSGPEKKKGGSRPYGRLSQVHEDYDAELIEELEDLYVGGYRLRRLSKKYLHQALNEHDLVYENRCRTAGYQGFFSQVVDQFVSELFAQPLSVTKPVDEAAEDAAVDQAPKRDFYSDFEKDADLQGHSFVDVVKSAMRTTLVHGRAYVAVDAPEASPGFEPTSKLDEEKAGLDRLYAYELPIESLINWKRDKRTKKFEWAVVCEKECVQDGPFDEQGRVREAFTVWTLDGGSARWERYAIEYEEGKDSPKPETLVPLEAEGVTRFSEVPIVPLEVPDGLWVGNKVGPMQREHWQRRSTLVAGEERSLLAVPVVALGPVIESGGAIPNEVAQDDARGDDPRRQFERKGFMTLARGDEWGFLEPEGKCYELVDRQLEKLRETILQVSHQMALSVTPTAGTAQRSGVSKQKDGESTSKVLRALGEKARLFAVEVYRAVSTARGEKVEWTAHGLDTYEDDDRSLVLEEAAGMTMLEEAIPSPTFHKAYAKVMARKLHPGLDPMELAKIDAEIEQGVDDRMEHAALERDAEKASIEAKKDVNEHPLSHVPPELKPPLPKAPPGAKPPASMPPKAAKPPSPPKK